MSESPATVTQILTFTVAPALGVVFSEFMAFGPLRAVLDCRKANSLGEVNPLPFPLLFGNGLAWVIYGVATKNIFVFLGNIGAPALSMFYLLTAHTLTTCAKTRLQMEIMVVFFISLWAIVGFSVAMLEDHETGSSVIGILGNITVFFLFASPLSTFSKVIKTRNSASINKPFAACQVLNCIVWVTYGLATSDLYVALPNVLGLLLGIAQIALLFRYPAVPLAAMASAKVPDTVTYSNFDESSSAESTNTV